MNYVKTLSRIAEGSKALILTILFCLASTSSACLLSNPGFDWGDTTGWTTTGGGSLSVSTSQAYEGSYSGKMSSRTATWQGPYRDLVGQLTNYYTYEFSCWMRMASANDTVTLTFIKQDDSNGGVATYTTIDSTSVGAAAWQNLSGSQTITITGTLVKLGVYTQTASSTTGSVIFLL